MDGRVAGGHVWREEWSIRLHKVVAEKLQENPQEVITKARRNLSMMKQAHGPTVRKYVARWEKLIEGPVEELITVMVSPSPEARDLRQCTPFAGVLTPKERWAIFRACRDEWRRNHAAGPA